MPHENCFVPFGERIFPRVVDENKFLFLVVVTLACLHLSLTHIFKFKMNDTLGRSKVIPVIESYEFETENISLFVPDRDFSIQLSSVNFSWIYFKDIVSRFIDNIYHHDIYFVFDS